jgi:hypothetical protein
VAERNPDAEVFIFHQKRRRHTLFLFARRDGEFRYYRGGRLVARESYWRDHGDRRLDPEVELHERFRADDGPRSASLFLYLGHEIPEYGGAGYDASYRKRAFTIGDLADGVRRMSHESKKFDVIVLATLSERSPGFAEHGDCAGDPTFARPGMADGVDVFYRAPRFGRQSSVQDHSGWQCWRLPE